MISTETRPMSDADRTPNGTETSPASPPPLKNGSLPAPKRTSSNMINPRGGTVQSVPTGPIETIRHRLGLSQVEMAQAIGYAESSYSTALNRGTISKTAALAAEALMRRQGQAAVAEDRLLVVHMREGRAQILDRAEADELRIKGKRYLLVPAD